MDLRQRLQLIVDATTGKADAEFRKLTGTTREMGTAAQRSADQVRAAAERVADARERERVAAGQLQVAERRLQELRDSGRAKASQLLAAEEKAAAAQRNLQRAVHGTQRALEEQQQSQRGAARAMAETATENDRSAGLLAGGLSRARAAMVGIGAAGLGAFLRSTAEGFTEAARSAGLFATSTNSSVEQAGQFLGLVGALGLDLNDLLEIQAEYAQKAAASAGDLDKLGAQLERNDDGTVNWTESLVSFLDQLQQVPDATERNRIGFQFLGEEGYKQLSRLVSSGVDVRDALERIGTPFTQEDVQAAAAFDASLMGLSLAGQRAGQDLGRILVPAVTQVLELFGDVIDVVDGVPGPVLIATAAAITMGLTGFQPATLAAGRLAAVTAVASRNLALFRTAAAIAGTGAAAFGAAAGAASAGVGLVQAGVGRLTALAGGPLGVALIAGSFAMAAASDGAERLEKRAHDAAVELGNLSGDAADIAIRRTANELEESAGYWERSAAYVKGYESDLGSFGQSMTWLTGPFQRLTMGFGDTADTAKGFQLQIEQAREELGEFGVQQEQAQQSTRTLNDLLAQGVTSGDEFGRAVRDAAEAQNAQEATSGRATAAIDAYNAVTRDALDTTLGLIDAQFGARDSRYAFLDALDAAEGAEDDATTRVNEQEQAYYRLAQAALRSATDSADAAVEHARAAGTILDAASEARIRADSMLADLGDSLKLADTEEGKARIQEVIDKLKAARDAGDIDAVLTLTGADTAKGELDETTKDRETRVQVESRGGPAVKSYLDGLAAAKRLALIRTESRNGPAVRAYLDGLAAQQRLSLIRVETRNGPAVRQYLNDLTTNYGSGWTAFVDVRPRGGAGGGAGAGTGAPAALLSGAPATAGGTYSSGGVVIQQQTVVLQADSAGRVTQRSLAEAGRQAVEQIRAYERRNGTGWRQGGRQ